MLGAADLSAAAYGGVIPEDVMNRIWDISRIPLPVTDAIGSDSSEAEWKEWVRDELQAVNLGNAYSEKHSWTTEDDSQVSERVRNHTQLFMKRIKVAQRARDTGEYGTRDSLENQIVRRQQENRRDMEGIILQSTQISQVDGGAGTPGLLGSLGTWLETNTDHGATGSAGGFNTSTGLTVAPTVGTPRALSESVVRSVATSAWKQGGDPTLFVSVPDVVDKFSDYLFTSSARVATLQSDTGQGEGGVKAKGYVDVFESNNGVVLSLIGNRLQQIEDPQGTPYANAYIIDPMYLSWAYVTGHRVDPLSKTGPQEDRQMSCDATLVVHTEKAHGGIFDIDTTAAVVP